MHMPFYPPKDLFLAFLVVLHPLWKFHLFQPIVSYMYKVRVFTFFPLFSRDLMCKI